MDIEVILCQSSFFNGLSDANRKTISTVCTPKSIRKREYLFHEGEQGEAAYFLSSGSVQLVKTTPAGREVVVKTVEPGETFAEVVLCEQDRYPVTALALKKSKVYRIMKRDFLGFLEDVAFSRDFIGMLARRMRYLADRILQLMACDVEQRFFRFLESQYGRKDEYHLSMARKDIAAAAGATPETLSRLVLRLKKEGKISFKGKTLRVKPTVWKCLNE